MQGFQFPDRWHCERVGLKIGNFLSEKRYTSQKQINYTPHVKFIALLPCWFRDEISVPATDFCQARRQKQNNRLCHGFPPLLSRPLKFQQVSSRSPVE
jgi:hypothetical protein